DPRQRYVEGLRILSSAYYQEPEKFADRFTALFAGDSAVAQALAASGRCVLYFQQEQRGYAVPCTTAELMQEDGAYQATYWHNHLFNSHPRTPSASWTSPRIGLGQKPSNSK